MRRGRIGRTLARLILYGLPVALWTAVLLVYSAGEGGGYTRSLWLLQHVIIGLTPGMDYKLDDGLLIDVSMYQLNAAFRVLAHVFVYAVLTILVVRLLQAGHHRLKGWSYAAAVLVSILYMALDESQRLHEPDRHAKPMDLILNLIGVALVLGGTPLFFAVKAWERRLAEDPAPKAASRESTPKEK